MGLEDRMVALEGHVTGQDREKPGLLMRMDRIETLMRLAVAMGGLGVLWKLAEAGLALMALKRGD